MDKSENNSINVVISSGKLGVDDQFLVDNAVKRVQGNGIKCEYINNSLSTAHIVLVDVDTIDGASLMASLRPGQIKFALSDERTVGKNVVSVVRPVTSEILSGLLERVIIQLLEQLKSIAHKCTDAPQAAASAPQPAAKPQQSVRVEHSEDLPSPIKTLFHTLYAAKEDGQLLRVSAKQLPPLIVNGLGKTIITEASPEQKREMMMMDSTEIVVEHITQSEFPAFPADNLRIIPLDGAVWESGLLWRTNKLMGGCDYDQQVKLKAWPNFTRSNFFPLHMKLCATLSARAMSLNDLQEMTSVPMEEITKYFNAAYAVGLIDLDPTGAKQLSRKKLDAERRGLLSKLAHRFGLS